ncbi:aldo/keto reductase [Halococcus sp. IIIV-5B]|uniref:aldo/keto reductase n=1 Tax=Halococcus sp. IIIV-5B TaxID=2321230 RepID=UPI000E748FD5|nr:aldo/keto reductase [Halococcus sp. IIIV-5B]RJT07183.1 aldo/keto reductase [Halococcus sp. IIIV-5B]
MEYKRLGTTGLDVSPICLGTWRFGLKHEESGVMETDREEAHELLGAFEARGGNFMPDGSRADVDEHFEHDYMADTIWDVLDEIRTVGNEVGASPAQVALRWLMDHDRFNCVPIVGARTVDQLNGNFDSIDVSISDEQFDRIDGVIER